jgi:hypothetical protein
MTKYNVIPVFDRDLKKQQPSLPLERNGSQGQGEPNDVRGSTSLEDGRTYPDPSGGRAHARQSEKRGAACSNESIFPASRQRWLILS